MSAGTLRLALLEAAAEPGLVALADGGRIVAERALPADRRRARDLVPALGDLLDAAGWGRMGFGGVAVGTGPGSFTGLRVALMAAKTLAEVAGVPLFPVPTFAAIAASLEPPSGVRLHVLAEAARDIVALQTFLDGVATGPAELLPADLLETRLLPGEWAAGTALARLSRPLPAGVTDTGVARPTAASLLRVALGVAAADPDAVEPTYLRQSAAEEKLG